MLCDLMKKFFLERGTEFSGGKRKNLSLKGTTLIYIHMEKKNDSMKIIDLQKKKKQIDVFPTL